MLRVLLVATNQEHTPDPVMPIGVAYVANAIRRRGHVTKIFDACFLGSGWQRALASTITQFRPDVIGISLRNVDNVAFPAAISYLDQARAAAESCRCHAPESTLFIGGSAFSLLPEKFMEALNPDYGIVGEGEVPMAEMIDELDRHGRVVGKWADATGIVRRPPTREMDQGIVPARDLLEVERYFERGGSTNVQTKRGCIHRCIYCTYPLLEGHVVRVRDPVEVVDELAMIVERGAGDFVFFVDSVFNEPLWHATAICGEILRRGLKFSWTAYVTPAGCTAELLELMVSAGCRSIELGTDSMCDAQLKRLGKGFDKRQVERVASWCHDVGLRFSHALVFGGPGETWDTVGETIDEVRQTRAHAVIATIGLRLYPNTALARYVADRGLIDRRQIGIDPVFFIAPDVEHGLVERLEAVAEHAGNWILPGLGTNMDPGLFSRLRARGFKGPLWELLSGP